MSKLSTLPGLLRKYDVPAPRYTSYPTVPYWDFAGFDMTKWKQKVEHTFREENSELSIYIHLPFCESLCTFCACNKRITRNHAVEDPYIDTVLKEWNLYLSLLPSTRVIREIHLGGGTPTFFSPENLRRLIKGITETSLVTRDHIFSVEVHPNFTSEEHLHALAESGFNRVSIGIQDFDPVVQQAINRVQSFERTRETVEWARKYGYTSVNVDLVYGLPHQTIYSIHHTIDRVRQLKPDRIAFYSYAHVPWKSKVQRRYEEKDLPTADKKIQMYQAGELLLLEAGFQRIGMDHFALPEDPLFVSLQKGNLNRNFMGYTTTQSKLIIGLGASAISDAWGAFAQNEKIVEDYSAMVNEGVLPIINGHLLTKEDEIIRQMILDLMCRNQTVLQEIPERPEYVADVLGRLAPMVNDGLVSVEESRNIFITATGRWFMRNICAAFDARLWRKQTGAELFSKSI